MDNDNRYVNEKKENDINADNEVLQKSPMPRLRNILLNIDRENLIQGIVLSDILEKPKAKRRRR